MPWLCPNHDQKERGDKCTGFGSLEELGLEGSGGKDRDSYFPPSVLLAAACLNSAGLRAPRTAREGMDVRLTSRRLGLERLRCRCSHRDQKQQCGKWCANTAALAWVDPQHGHECHLSDRQDRQDVAPLSVAWSWVAVRR